MKMSKIFVDSSSLGEEKYTGIPTYLFNLSDNIDVSERKNFTLISLMMCVNVTANVKNRFKVL